MIKLRYSVIIPAYNEEKYIEKTIDIVYNMFRKHIKRPFEIIIANDGSTDSTPDKVKKKMKKYRNLRIVSNEINRGRGSILKKSFKSAKGEIQIYLDADLQISTDIIFDVINALNNGYDVAIGSKHIKGSNIKYPKIRRFFSKVYSFLAKIFLGGNIKDFQCGLKGFRKVVIKTVLPHVKSDGWSWDTEIIIKSIWKGYSVKEIPAKVRNVYKRESKVHLLKDVINMGSFLIYLFFQRFSYKG